MYTRKCQHMLYFVCVALSQLLLQVPAALVLVRTCCGISIQLDISIRLASLSVTRSTFSAWQQRVEKKSSKAKQS